VLWRVMAWHGVTWRDGGGLRQVLWRCGDASIWGPKLSGVAKFMCGAPVS